MTLSSIRIAVDTVLCTSAWLSFASLTWSARFTEPRLHTAVSSLDVLSVISVQRFELCTTPTWSCGERMLDGSLNVIHGCPVSNSMVTIFFHRSRAFIFLNRRIFPSSAIFSRSEEHTSELQS